ncbi:MAG TPA: hypothetical protein EYP65_02695 [Armatimonadetes bacterium]|nr:hypothetical protein [Armatimonadota bacterium]
MKGRERFGAFDGLVFSVALVAVLGFVAVRHLLEDWLLLVSSLSLVSCGALLLPGGLWSGPVAGGLALLGASLPQLGVGLKVLVVAVGAGLGASWWLISGRANEGRRAGLSVAIFSVGASLSVMLARQAVGGATTPLMRMVLGLPGAVPLALVLVLFSHPLMRSGGRKVWSTALGVMMAILGGFAWGRGGGDPAWPIVWLLAPLAVPLIGGVTCEWGRRHALRAVAGAVVAGAVLTWFLSLGLLPLGLLALSILSGLGALADPLKGATLREMREAVAASPARAVGGALYSVAMIGLLWGGAKVALAKVPRYKGMIVASAGEVFVKFRGSKEWAPAPWGTLLSEGDELRTGAGSAAIIRFGDGSVVKASSGTEVRVESFKEEGGVFARRLKLRVGRLWLRVRRAVKGYFEVETRAAVAGVRGTDYSVASLPDQTYVSCWSGAASVTAGGWTVVVRAGQETRVRRGRRPEKPRPMSPDEIERWRRELPALEAPAPESLWERRLQGTTLADNFDDGRIDLGTWMVISSDPAVNVKEEGGELRIFGMRSKPGELFEVGLSSQPFSQTSVEVSARIRFVKGHGRAEVRLCGEKESVGFGFQAGKGYLLVTSGRWPGIVAVADPFGDEEFASHTVALLYDATTKRARAYLDGAFVGAAKVDLGDEVRAALLYVTRRPADRIDCSFDDFRSNITVGVALPVALAVGAIFDSKGDETPSPFFLLKPLSPKALELLRSVEVKKPKPIAAPSPLFAKGVQALRLPRRGDFWAEVEKDAGRPIEGDYIFGFTIGAGSRTVRWLSVKGASLLPPTIIRLKKEEVALHLAWSAEGATSFWVDLVDVGKNKLIARERLGATERSVSLYPTLFGGEKVVAVIRAFSRAPSPGTEEAVSQALWAMDSLAPPGGLYWASLAAPGGEIEVACTKTGVMRW